MFESAQLSMGSRSHTEMNEVFQRAGKSWDRKLLVSYWQSKRGMFSFSPDSPGL